MDAKTFLSLAALGGLDLSGDHARDLHDYVRQLFVSLKPGLPPVFGDGGESSDRVGRIFGPVRSIGELDLDQVEPAIHFSPKHQD